MFAILKAATDLNLYKEVNSAKPSPSVSLVTSLSSVKMLDEGIQYLLQYATVDIITEQRVTLKEWEGEYLELATKLVPRNPY